MDKLYEDILTFFPEFRMTISDLKSPTASFVRDFFCRTLIELGVDVDNVRRVQIDQLDAEEMDIIPELNLVSALRTVFPFLGFRLNDLISPEIKRNANLMSHLMHFLQFCDARCAANNNRIEEFQSARNTEIELVKMKEKLSTMLNNLACEVDSQMQAKEQLEKDIAMLQNYIGKFKNEEKGICEPMREAQEMLSNKERKINSLKSEINMISTEYEELKKLMVNNPDEVQRDLEAKSRDRDRVIERKKEYQEKLKSLNDSNDKLQRLGELLTKRVKPLLQELHILQDYSELKSSNEEKIETVKELQNKKEELLKNLEEIEKKFEFGENNIIKRKTDLEREEASVKEAWESIKSDYKLKSKDVKQAENTFKQELEKVNRRIESIENYYLNLLARYMSTKALLFQ